MPGKRLKGQLRLPDSWAVGGFRGADGGCDLRAGGGPLSGAPLFGVGTGSVGRAAPVTAKSERGSDGGGSVAKDRGKTIATKAVGRSSPSLLLTGPSRTAARSRRPGDLFGRR